MMQADIDQFFLFRLISKGTYAKVYLAKKKDTNKFYAIKKLKKKQIDQKKQAQYVMMEKTILNQEKHQFIVYPQYQFEQVNHFYFVSEYCVGGDLFSLFKAKGKFKEKHIQFYAILIIHALQFLHTQKIIYRDLKPKNILIDEKGYIKLTDFGLSKILQQEMTEQVQGTLEYLAPEILNQIGDGYDYKVDCWSLGCLLYELIAECPPFMSEQRDKLISLIKTTQPKFNFPISDELKDLIIRLLQKDPNQRPSLVEIKEFPFFQNVKDWESYLSYKVASPFLPIIQYEDIWRFDPGFTQSEQSGDAIDGSDKDNKIPGFFGNNSQQQ
ncbi:unnamed protein product (macronuclear) [Paramecium tetraurelia]|uniref:non-specific serine/threonine protein kinase n=1 Tax=Paramecium tetraurelia TaxID=5888 RepID=A0BSF2_PARTE|nr:uncharacterized protein GSPATT00031701001 [Paramecium tetraurelia]CAK61469.1 unnamed protein product [Paramecium tetraurelia]|eukprot:XP_001428867.1 hypothetical protein (macronuclear) [Paramecium tetraurelia strain d4-2]